MDQVGEWRLIDAEHEEPSGKSKGPDQGSDRSISWRVWAVVGATAVTIVGIAIWLTLPTASVSVAGNNGAFVLDPAVGGTRAGPAGSPVARASAVAGTIVVDVEGAVMRPGVQHIPAGSRLSDAVAAAGGYSMQVDIGAAAQQLNLAELLADGAKVHVPARGEAAVPAPGSNSGAAPSAPGLVDINHATAEQLDTLPGVGPVTAAKIIASREQAQFAAIDELVSRGVVGQSTYDKLSSLVTVTP